LREVTVANTTKIHNVFLEIGKKKVFTGSLEWPGWGRFGRDGASAIQALLDSAPRFLRIVEAVELGFVPPEKSTDFKVVESVDGNATTDFGAPDAELSIDREPIGAGEMVRFSSLLSSCWVAFDRATKEGEGKELRKGPRGGGRNLERIVDHVMMADESYLKRIGWKLQKVGGDDLDQRLERVRREILDGLEAAAHGQLPTVGPRGGKRWTARFFVRRVAWHVIDHAWEIEDRIY
jgi:hypothetical protein